MGSLGFLAGPPVIGVLADALSLPWALSLLILGAVVVFALARRATGAHAARARAGARTAPARPGGGAVSFAAVISDLDGVLVDSAAATSRAWARGARARARRRGDPGRPTTAAPPRVCSQSTFRRKRSTPRRRSCWTPRSPTPRASSRSGRARRAGAARRRDATSCTLPLAHARLPRPGWTSRRCWSAPTRSPVASPRRTPTCWRPSALASTRRTAWCSRTRRAASPPVARRE